MSEMNVEDPATPTAQTSPSKIPTPWIALKLWFISHKTSRWLWHASQYLSLSLFNGLNGCWRLLTDNSTHCCRIDAYAKRLLSKHAMLLTFFKALVMNPSATGAIFPSSKRLAQEMASHVLLDDSALVVELGSGTGVVTDALLQAGVNPNQLILVEYSPDLVQKLRLRFPHVRIIEGNAAQLGTLLRDENTVKTIISSLPLRSLPPSTTHAILDQIKTILPSGGRYIQFTYSLRQNKLVPFRNQQKIISKHIWRNIPPARVDVWTV